MKIKANGISINYQVDGLDGAPWLVLSNSLATNLAMWDDQVRELGRAFRVLRYDQRGHGTTEAPAGRYTFELLIADALALMDALAIKRAHFGGLSMGGATALGLAQKHPDRLDRVIVCDSPCQSTPTSSQQWAARVTWSWPAPGTFPTSTSPRLSPARSRISWPPNEGPAAPACRCVDCKVSGRGAIPLVRVDPGSGAAESFRSFGL